jgi:two-component sensor histidine kinase/integral membrane sensor domain MASE1
LTSVIFEKHKLACAVGLYAICLIAAWFTELLIAVSGSGISIWLPAGCLFAAALASPMLRWPLWAAAAAAAEFTGNMIWYNHEIGPIAVLVSGNVVGALSGAYVLRRKLEPTFIISSVRSTALFIAVTIFLIPLISATIASVALGWSYGNPPFAAWRRILLGDATGAIVAAPFALVLLGVAAPLPHMSRNKWLEAVILVLTFAGMAVLSLGGFVPFSFLMIPLLIWAALRFRVVGAVTAVVALTMFTAMFTLVGASPFAPTAGGSEFGNIGLQLFLLVASITALMMAALSEENRTSLRQLQAANQSLGSQAAQSEAYARTTAGLLNAIGEACPNLIYAKNLNYEIIYANGATLTALGAASLEDLNRTGEAAYYDVESEFDQIRINDKQVFESKKTIVFEELVTDGSGEVRVYRTTKAPLYDGAGKLTGLAGVSVEISDIKRAQYRERMLVREVDHRSRNLLAVAQGIVNLTAADSVAEFKKTFGRRLGALARTNGAIAAANWKGASLNKIIDEEVAPYLKSDSSNVEVSGTDVELDPSTAQSLTLVIHELTTNAAKYGALSTDKGKLQIEWATTELIGRQRKVYLNWSETGGPVVSPPKTEGFGSMMIRLFGEEQPESRISMNWRPQGLKVELTFVSTHRKAMATDVNDALLIAETARNAPEQTVTS